MEQRESEICEHKGIGHPDSIADGVCEASSRELSLAYIRAYGRVLHHNLDKGLLVAGRSAPRFGGGTLLEPIRLIVCGRATRADGRVEARQVVPAAARRYLAQNIRYGRDNFRIETEIKEGSANLKAVFSRQAAVVLANDTSFGAGFAPYSRLELAVLALSRALKSPAFKKMFPCAGDDFKIMGRRVKGEMGFTVALALVDRQVRDAAHYFALKEEILAHLGRVLDAPAAIRLNTLDDPGARNEDGLYLTVTGLSAEMGDDGQVGRGNRASGLITPGRAMSLEAVAGKNPVSHVGKLYNVLAGLIARDVCAQLDEVDGAGVELLSAIGQPVDQPQIVVIEIDSRQAGSGALRKKAALVADRRLRDMERVTTLILDEKVPRSRGATKKPRRAGVS